MTDFYPIGLPSNNDPFSEDDQLDDETITRYASLTDDDYVGEDDAIDTSAEDEDQRGEDPHQRPDT